MDNQLQLVDLLDLDIDGFQQLQDNFAKALDLGFITVDYRGRPLIKYSGFTEFCNKIRKREECLRLCHQCDAHGGLHATLTGEPYIYRCHAGLVDFAVPLIFDGRYMGSVMGGQVEFIGPAPELRPVLPQMTEWKDDPELVDASGKVHKATYEKLVASVYLLRDMMQNLLEKKYYKLAMEDLEKKKRELREERAALIRIEDEMEKHGTAALNTYFGNDFMLYILNVISRLACREHAPETEHAVCDFADMLRYMTENRNSNFVTIGEELEYIEYYLHIQTFRLGERFSYKIEVQEAFRGVLCPFMLLQPLVENSMRHGVEQGGTLSIHGKAEGGLFLLMIRDSGVGMTRKQISSLGLDGNNTRSTGKKFLANMNRKLKELFGEACGVYIRSKEDGFSGTEVQIRLPMSNAAIE